MAEEAGDAFDKLKAGAKAVAKKVTDPNRDLGTEYEKEKIKEGAEDYETRSIRQQWSDVSRKNRITRTHSSQKR